MTAARRVRMIASDGQIYEFDATLSQEYVQTTKVTTHPIETGSTVADHLIHEPDTVSLDVIMSTTPIDRTAAIYYVESFFKELSDQRRRGALFSVDSSLIRPVRPPATESNPDRVGPDALLGEFFVGELPQLIITDLRAMRDQDTGKAVNLKITLQHLEFVYTQRTTSAGITSNQQMTVGLGGAAGNVPTTEADAATADKGNQSLGKDASDFLGIEAALQAEQKRRREAAK